MIALFLPAAFAATYTLDSSHTRAGFNVTHMMVTTVRGVFGTTTGTVEYDPNNLPATTVNATVAIASIDTREAKRDDHLRSPDFFDAAAFPQMTFVSKAVKNAGPAGLDLVGDLTIRGVTKEIVLHVDPFTPEVKDPSGNLKVGTRATGTINRQDFGVSWNKKLDGGGYLLSDDVRIELDVEMARKP